MIDLYFWTTPNGYKVTKFRPSSERYTKEAARLYRVIDRRLAETEYLAGEYSIADVATFPWIRPYRWQGQDLDEYPNLKRWFNAIKVRPAVQEGLAVLAETKKWEAKPGSEAWKNMFNKNV